MLLVLVVLLDFMVLVVLVAFVALVGRIASRVVLVQVTSWC